jgi:hypothetical protein
VQLTRIGTLPVSALNIGLVTVAGGMTAEITKLGASIVEITPAIAVQTAFSATPPEPVSLGIAVADFAANAGSVITPGAFPTVAAGVSAEITVKLGAVELQIPIVKELTASLGAGFFAGGIAGWTYAGRGRGFGQRLKQVLPAGFAGATGKDTVSALVLATESFEAWGNFGRGFDVGASSNLGPTTTKESLSFMGAHSGGEWNTGVARFKAQLDLLLAELEGIAATLSAQLQLCAGVGLPAVDVVVGLVTALDLEALLGDFFEIDVDVEGSLGIIQARIDAILDLQAELNGMLAGGGLSLWVYTGSLEDLGTAMATELERGMPGGSGPDTPVYGLALACASPSAWSDFGMIFKNAA